MRTTTCILFKTTHKINLVCFLSLFLYFILFKFFHKEWKKLVILWTSFWHYFLATHYWTTQSSGNSRVAPLPIQNFILSKRCGVIGDSEIGPLDLWFLNFYDKGLILYYSILKKEKEKDCWMNGSINTTHERLTKSLVRTEFWVNLIAVALKLINILFFCLFAFSCQKIVTDKW